jgi:hypothetical protein
MGNDQGSLLMESVESVSIDQDVITVNFRSVPELKRRLRKTAARLRYLRDEIALLGDPLTVRVYYIKLMESSGEHSTSMSLADFIHPLFRLAKERSRDADPADENQAAILALAMYLGDSGFGRLIGPVLTDEMKRHKRPGKVTLAGREDLRLHFVISAGLKVVADSGLSSAAGEFKELLDAAGGGSGFSFADLAADIAGIRLAEVATGRSGQAARLQRLLSENAGEDLFFPDVRGLPENLQEKEFDRRYGNVESKEYRAFVNRIEEAVSRLPAYVVSKK